MAIGIIGALALLHRTFHRSPFRARVHILGRFLTCPFLRTLPALPRNATILDIGAGHGAFAKLAVADGARRVVALEPDLRKTLTSYDDPRVAFVAGFDDAIRGRFDAITMFDVLYRVSRNDWDRLFRDVRSRLAADGVFLIKELDPEHRVKSFWNRIQESVSINLLRLTLGEAFSYETKAQMRERLLSAGFTSVEAHDIGAWYPHAHVMYVARAARTP